MHINIKIVPVGNAEFIVPEVQTAESACADVAVCLNHVDKVKMYDSDNNEYFQPVENRDGVMKFVVLRPNHRALIPTGMRFIIKHGFQIKMIPRSGLSLKHGVTLINSPGTIDSDYTNETMILLHNTSNVPFICSHHERVAQLELRENTMKCVFFTEGTDEEIEKHKKSSNRKGGFGSTGRKA